MNSLNDLNGHSQTTSVSFTDDRAPRLIFDRDSATNTSVTINEGQPHLVPRTIELTEVINYDQMTSFYQITLSSVTGATLTWPTLPAHMTATTPSAGVYRIEGFRTAADWLTVRAPTVNSAFGVTGSFTYTVALGYTVGATTTQKTWSVALTVNNLDILTQPSDFFWTLSTTQTLTGVPLIQDESLSNPTFSLVIIPSSLNPITSFSSSGSGGASSYNASTKRLTITGTKVQVNSHLQNISYTASSSAENFSLTYQISNSLTAETDTKTQQLKCADIRYLSLVSTPIVVYNEDTAAAVSGGPTITDADYDGSGTYVLTVTGPGVKTLAATGTGGSATFNNSTKTLSIVGTRTQVNTYIPNITMTPLADYASTFNLTYAVTTPRSATQSKAQSMQIGALDPEVTGVSDRYYFKNTETYIFGTTTYINTSGSSTYMAQTAPQITDLDTEPTNTYTVTLTVGGTHRFSINGVTESASVSFTGSKATVNSQLGSVRFYAIKNSNSTISVGYTQSKNGNVQVSTTFNLLYQNTGGTTFVRDHIITASGTWTPPIDARKYASNADAILVGGGGAGTTGAGGGGGGIQTVTGQQLTAASYNITIGQGGTPVYAPDLNSANLAIMRGGTTTAFTYSAPGGEGGRWTTSGGLNYFTGGAAGTRNGAPGATGGGGNVGFSTAAVENGLFRGGGGGGAAFNDVTSGGSPFSPNGGNGQYQSGYGHNGGIGGAPYEFPADSFNFYGGGGGGAGGNAEYSLGGGQYNVNGGNSFYDFDYYPSGVTLPLAYGPWGGGGIGRAPGDNTASNIATQTLRYVGAKGGGGGGSFSTTTGAGTGGAGVVVVRYNP